MPRLPKRKTSCMNETLITVIGGFTADPEARQAGSYRVTTFSLASTPRRFDKSANEWKDGTPTYWNCEAWGPLGEAIMAEFTRGRQVIAVGNVETQTWVDKSSGEKRSRMTLNVQEIGGKLARGARNNQPTSRQSAPERPQGQDEPWATTPRGSGTPGGYNDETPF